MEHNHRKALLNSKGKDTQKEIVKKLFKALEKEPMSRRMAATAIGLTDQTYMVTQYIYDWIKEEKAQVIGLIKCSRSGRWVQKVTTNPELFISVNVNQLNLFTS
jgi:glycine/serine hydroxymethyltransferase